MTNIALIVLDTLRKDKFDEHFDWLPGRRYENAWSTSHWTVPAHASLFTGKYASEVGIHAGSQSFDCEEPLLAETLSNNDYTTRAFSANPNISPAFEAHRGFDDFKGNFRLEGLEEGMFDWEKFIAESRDMGYERFAIALKRCVFGDYRTLPSVKHGVKLKLRDMGIGSKVVSGGAEMALDLIQNAEFGEKEFLFVNLMEAHAPYDPPKPFKSVDVNIDTLYASMDRPSDPPKDIKTAYDDSVRYLSHIYRQVFDSLRADFDTIITVGDHGELLGEHDAWGHLYGLHPELTNVPLSIYTGNGSNVEISESVNLCDVYQTTLHSAGIETNSRGRDLLSITDDGEFVVEYHGLCERNYLALQNKGFDDLSHMDDELGGLVTGDFYGYETFEGWEEFGTSPYSSARDRLETLLVERDKRSVDNEKQDLDDEILGRLEDLGYA
ncbi:Arylsulfatase A [Haladaptatus litoreus]|uniref:Arylsulfatase A n=1 Tax=Haladaptatus litoreus TaxID=553468 RepID=A0A1N6YT15_9EURY|nr:sulfatase-like hydrolase/transferase [Haladaptatus litoreus]SIR17707.1 Arylsulfatase A [Haladaptatus litoreus]